MDWINYKKSLQYGHQSWIVHYLKMNKIPDKVIQFIEKTMETWKVELTAGGKGLAEVKIQRGLVGWLVLRRI